MRVVHLVCNAHLDPVWLWEWEEGAAEAISTFRVAADFCTEHDSFVFNHNEVILYEWVEEYEPELFARIRELVAAGRWHIMGGWYLQPDCNLPSGEAFIRQALVGRRYFAEKFGARPTTAINFDPFGHSRGLVQILAGCGYDSYVVTRPGEMELPAPAFRWQGFAGSEVKVLRAHAGYLSHRGKAAKKVRGWLETFPDDAVGCVLWGVGNHGGGASREDLAALDELAAESADLSLLHSTPEAWFAARQDQDDWPVVARDLNPWAVGCYTSQVRIKQQYRELENALFATEKMLTATGLAGRLEYPAADLEAAQRDLLTAQFHDILPGSSIEPVEAAALRGLDHGLEIVSRLRARAFFALAGGQPKAAEGEVPILVYNPHPHPVRTLVECEFQLADQNWNEGEFTIAHLRQGEHQLPSQMEQEVSNLNLDWRKRVVFAAELPPGRMSRFDCAFEVLPERPRPTWRQLDGHLEIRSEDLDVLISTRTGCLERCRMGDVAALAPGAGRLLVMADDEDPWGMRVDRFRDLVGEFRVLDPRRAARFAGVRGHELAPVRVIEDGPVRTVVEVLMGYGDSHACVHYKLPKRGTEIELSLRVYWQEKNRMLKWSLPTTFNAAEVCGQTAFGIQPLGMDGGEAVIQKWAMVAAEGEALTVINAGSYGADFHDGELRLSLLRGAAYAGHPIGARPIVPQDRFLPRIDQGERCFRFWLNAGASAERRRLIDGEALARNERPMALSFFPSGHGNASPPGPCIDDPAVQLSAAKQAADGDGWVFRLYESSGQRRQCELRIPAADVVERLELDAHEVRTLRLRGDGRIEAANMIEEALE